MILFINSKRIPCEELQVILNLGKITPVFLAKGVFKDIKRNDNIHIKNKKEEIIFKGTLESFKKEDNFDIIEGRTESKKILNKTNKELIQFDDNSTLQSILSKILDYQINDKSTCVFKKPPVFYPNTSYLDFLKSLFLFVENQYYFNSIDKSFNIFKIPMLSKHQLIEGFNIYDYNIDFLDEEYFSIDKDITPYFELSGDEIETLKDSIKKINDNFNNSFMVSCDINLDFKIGEAVNVKLDSLNKTGTFLIDSIHYLDSRKNQHQILKFRGVPCF